MHRKKVGIIGGLGYASTLEYYRGIVEESVRYTNSNEYPELVITSLNMTEIVALIEKQSFEQLTQRLCKAVQELKNAGADFAVIASNTPHVVFDRLSEISVLPLISIVNVAVDAVLRCGYKNILLTGTAFTMKNGFYKNRLENHGIKCSVPNELDIEVINNIIFPDLENGIITQEHKQKFTALCEKYVAAGVQAVILGCTELPLLIQDGDISVPIINTMKLHVDAVVREIYR